MKYVTEALSLPCWHPKSLRACSQAVVLVVTLGAQTEWFCLLFQYFLFEFHEPRDILFHRLIEISVRMRSSSSFTCNWYSPMLLHVDAGGDGQGAQEGLCCLQVFHSKTIPFLGTCIGTFKMDVVTVYSQPGMMDCTACHLRLMLLVKAPYVKHLVHMRSSPYWLWAGDASCTFRGRVRASFVLLYLG